MNKVKPVKRKLFPPPLPVTRPLASRQAWRHDGSLVIEHAIHDKKHLKNEPERADHLGEDELLQSLNYLDQEGLQVFNGIGLAMSGQMIAYRETYGYFIELEDLLMVPGIGDRKFELIVGRPPQKGEGFLHRLMRIDERSSVTIKHLQPWKNPASGIDSIWFLPRGKAIEKERSLSEGFKCVQASVYSWRILFVLYADSPVSGRSAFLLNKLAALLRPIFNERSIATAN